MLRTAASQALRRTSLSGASRLGAPAASLQQQYFHVSSKREEESKDASAPVATSSSAWDPIYSIPLGIAFAIPALKYEWIVVNEEMQLAACFVAFALIVQKQFGGMIHEYLGEEGKRILAEHNKEEDAIIQALEERLEEIKQQETIVQDAENVYALKLETFEKLNAAGKVKPLYDFKAQVERMLTLIEHEEVSLKEKAKHELLNEATASVQQQFATSADLKKKSLANAISILKGSSKGSDDPVKAAYLKFFADKKVAASKGDATAEVAAAREAIVTKLNAVAKNEGYFFQFDTATGKPKMVV